MDGATRRRRIDEIHNYRIAQAGLKHFKEAMRSLEQQDRLIRLQQARAEGMRLSDMPMSDQEAEALDAQRHDYFSDWTPAEQERFKAEQSQLWSLIPEKFRQKAENLARGH